MLTTASEKRLIGIHPKLAELIRKSSVNSPFAFVITEGLRTEARQKQLVAQGASRTMKSKHLTGHAIDFAVIIGGKADFHFHLYEKVSTHMKKVAAKVGLTITWGGDWKSFKDGCHIELDPKKYPF